MPGSPICAVSASCGFTAALSYPPTGARCLGQVRTAYRAVPSAGSLEWVIGAGLLLGRPRHPGVAILLLLRQLLLLLGLYHRRATHGVQVLIW